MIRLFNVYSEILLFPFLAFVVSLVLTRAAIEWLPRLGFVDLPDGERRIHTKPTPRGGGIAIILTFFLITGGCVFFADNTVVGEFLWRFSIPAGILTLCGLIDDRFDMPAKLKLLLQIAAGVAISLSGLNIETLFGWQLPGWLSLVMTVFWVVAIVNAFNLIDGLDGVASGLAVVATLCLGVWCFLLNQDSGDILVLFIMGAACLGFLRYNFSPARIFLGDTGSMFIGLFFAFAGLHTMRQAVTMTTLLVPLLAVGVPLLDTTLAFWRRLMRRLYTVNSKGIMTADREHLHHRLFDKFMDQRKTALAIYLIAILFAGVGLIFILLDSLLPALGYLLLLLVVTLTVRRLATVELNASANALITGFRRPRRTLLFPLLQPFIDIGLLLGCYLFSMEIFQLPIPNVPVLLWFVVPVMLCITLAGNYRVYWLRASMHDYWRNFEAVAGGAVLGVIGAYYAANALNHSLSALLPVMVFYVVLTVTVIFGQRLIFRYLGEYVLPVLLARKNLNQQYVPVVMLGGGLNCRLYLNCIRGRLDGRPFRILGIIDDDLALRRFRINGYRVLGNTGELEKIHDRYKFEKIVVTPAELPEEIVTRLRTFAKLRHVELIRFRIIEETVPMD